MFASKQIIKIIQVVYDGVEGITAPTRLKDGRIHWEVFGTTPARRQDGKIPWEVFGRLAGVWSRTFHGILPYCRIAGGVVIGSGCGQILSIESCRLAVLPGCGQRYRYNGLNISGAGGLGDPLFKHDMLHVWWNLCIEFAMCNNITRSTAQIS